MQNLGRGSWHNLFGGSGNVYEDREGVKLFCRRAVRAGSKGETPRLARPSRELAGSSLYVFSHVQ